MHHVGCMAALNPTWFRAQRNADKTDMNLQNKFLLDVGATGSPRVNPLY